VETDDIPFMIEVEIIYLVDHVHYIDAKLKSELLVESRNNLKLWGPTGHGVKAVLINNEMTKQAKEKADNGQIIRNESCV